MRDLLGRLQAALPSIVDWIEDLHERHETAAVPVTQLGVPRVDALFPARLVQRARCVSLPAIPFPRHEDTAIMAVPYRRQW